MIFTGLRHIGDRFTAICVLAIVFAMTMVSCSDSLPDGIAGEDTEAGIVTFRIFTPKVSSARSRAGVTWGDSYVGQDGNEFETGLLESQLRVFITDEDCTEEYSVTQLYCSKIIETDYAVAYEYTGRVVSADIDKVKVLTNGKLHILANAGYNSRLSDDTSFALLGQPGAGFTAIPMWGVKSVDFSELRPNSILTIGDVHLLRAMAKVEISNDAKDENFISSIQQVTVSAVNQSGYALPDGWTGVANTKDVERYAVRIPEQEKLQSVSYNFMEDSTIEFYLPEIRNGSGNSEIRLTLTFTTLTGEVWTGDLFFREYMNGDPAGVPYDIRRNFLYRYKVSMPTINDFKVIADLKPYESVKLEPSFGI